ncbi:MAG: aspartate aminotransferase family protein [Pseudonocardiaceae bacterium]
MSDTLSVTERQKMGQRLLQSAYAELRGARPVSAAFHDRARRSLPGGTTRARFWEPMPLYIEKGEGAYITDLDSRTYIDCNLGQGPLVLGHKHPAVTAALRAQAPRGTHYGPPFETALLLAELAAESIPGAERVAFVNSGTEATMGALRIARQATGRRKVAKFEGGWHGSNEFTLYSFTTISGDPAHADANPDSRGLSSASAADVVILPFNDPRAVERIRAEGPELAGVIIEPVLGAGGCLPATPEFLQSLRDACDEVGAILIFDEVISGYRVGPRSAAGELGVTADLTVLGKAVGGGLPIGVICGDGDLMSRTMWPSGPNAGRGVAAGGTFSGNPMTTTAGLAQLTELLRNPESYPRLAALSTRLREGLEALFARLGVTAHVTGMGSMLGVHLTPTRPASIRDTAGADRLAAQLLRIYLELDGVVARGISFLSTAHSEEDVDRVVASHDKAMTRIRQEGCL